MKYPFFASFIVLCLLLMYEIHKRRNKEAKKYQEFWDEETKANNTRRKSLDDLNYITIPTDTLPLNILSDNEQIAEYQNTIINLSNEPIVNLTGFTNTQLKLKYGAPNIDLLSSYDQRYTLLARTLNDYGIALYDNGYTNEATQILEFAVSTKSDVSNTYLTLSKIYKANNEPEKIKELISTVSDINSLMKNSIISKLESSVNS